MSFAARFVALVALTLGSWAHGQTKSDIASEPLPVCASPDAGQDLAELDAHFVEVGPMLRLHRFGIWGFSIARVEFGNESPGQISLTLLIEDANLLACANRYLRAAKGTGANAKVFYSRGNDQTYRVIKAIAPIN